MRYHSDAPCNRIFPSQTKKGKLRNKKEKRKIYINVHDESSYIIFHQQNNVGEKMAEVPLYVVRVLSGGEKKISNHV